MSQPRPAKPNQTFGNPHENYSSPQSVKPPSARKSDAAAKKKSDADAKSEAKPASQPGSSMGIDRGSGIGLITQLFTLLSAVGVLTVGIIHIIFLLKNLNQTICNNTTGTGYSCIGTSLYWQNPYYKNYSSFLNIQWRYFYLFASGPFTFVLDPFFDNWTPIVFGLLACFQLFTKMRWHVVSGRWLHCMLFHLILALFCCFGYAGQAGIIIGFLVSLTGFMCACCEVVGNRTPCYMTLRLK